SCRLPGPRVGRRTRAREDPVQLFQRRVVEVQVERTQAAVQLVEGARADDRGGNPGARQQPGERNLRRRVTEVGAQGLVFLDLRTQLLQLLARVVRGGA